MSDSKRSSRHLPPDREPSDDEKERRRKNDRKRSLTIEESDGRPKKRSGNRSSGDDRGKKQGTNQKFVLVDVVNDKKGKNKEVDNDDNDQIHALQVQINEINKLLKTLIKEKKEKGKGKQKETTPDPEELADPEEPTDPDTVTDWPSNEFVLESIYGRDNSRSSRICDQPSSSKGADTYGQAGSSKFVSQTRLKRARLRPSRSTSDSSIRGRNKSRRSTPPPSSPPSSSPSPSLSPSYNNQPVYIIYETMDKELKNALRSEVNGIMERLPENTKLDVSETFERQKEVANKHIIPVIQKWIKGKFSVSDGVIKHIIRERHRHQRENFLKNQNAEKYDNDMRRRHANSRRSDKRDRRKKTIDKLARLGDRLINNFYNDELQPIKFDNKYHSPEASTTDEDNPSKRRIVVRDLDWRSSALRIFLRDYLDRINNPTSESRRSRQRLYDNTKFAPDEVAPSSAPKWTKAGYNGSLKLLIESYTNSAENAEDEFGWNKVNENSKNGDDEIEIGGSDGDEIGGCEYRNDDEDDDGDTIRETGGTQTSMSVVSEQYDSDYCEDEEDL